jgi:DNA-binding YbaB/EbfC family protein
MNFNQIMKQAQAMQKKMTEMQDEMAKQEFEGSSGGGAVKIALNGKGVMNSIKLDPSIVSAEEVEILEDLIIAAFNDAKKKLDETAESSFGSLMPNGMKFPF